MADPAALSTRVYNIRGFSATAGEIRDETLKHFPDVDVRFEPVANRQAIVDSWPADVDDTLARRDWGFGPRFGLSESLGDYLVPALRRRMESSPDPA
jgi:threonine 3-dehydrogenase